MPVPRSRRLVRLNRLVRLGRGEEEPLRAERLIASARRTTGLSDFGGESFREPLGRLVDALETEAQLSPIGRQITRARLHDVLASRLRITRDRAEIPALAAQEIKAPVFVVGLPRSGTTILHHLLAQNETTLTPLQWKLDFPSPPPARQAGPLESRFWKTRLRETLLYAMLPELRVVHTVAAALPHECVVMMGHDFTSLVYSIPYRVPSYEQWLLGADPRSAYGWHRRFLQQFQLRVSDPRWVLKSPTHLLSLDALFETYPDARIVWTHRDPVEALASIASLTETLRRLTSDAPQDPGELGVRCLEFWSQALARAQAFRREHPDLESRFLDVDFGAICREPVAAIYEIAERCDIPIAEQSWRAIRRFARGHPRHGSGRHRYALADYELEGPEVAERCAPYRKWRGYEDRLVDCSPAGQHG